MEDGVHGIIHWEINLNGNHRITFPVLNISDLYNGPDKYEAMQIWREYVPQ